MTGYSECQVCHDRLRHVTIFCLKCGRPSCSWQCHRRHLAEHEAGGQATSPGRQPSETLALEQTSETSVHRPESAQ